MHLEKSKETIKKVTQIIIQFTNNKTDAKSNKNLGIGYLF